MENFNSFDDEMIMKELEKREKESKIEYDNDIPNWIDKETDNKSSLGNVHSPLGMENEWKNLPLSNLPSMGFGYPPGFEISIRAARVSEIRHWSTIDEYDQLDIDDKINYILNKCTRIRWDGGFLEAYDLWYDDRFYVIMAIRDLTFIKGENRILLNVNKTCSKKDCPIPDQIELKADLLESYKLDEELIKRYDKNSYSFKLIPKDGSPEINLHIPTVGVVTLCRKIISEKKDKNKHYDQSFANIASYIIPNWRDLDEKLYDQMERESQNWTLMQYSIVDQVSKKITFGTKSTIHLKCNKCGGEATVNISFPRGYRSLFIISNIFEQLL